MPVQFKFRGEKAFRSLLNVTTPCTLQRVKSAIYEQARISDSSTDLAFDDEVTGETLDPRSLLVPDGLVQVIVRRTPFQQDVLSVQLGGSGAKAVVAVDAVALRDEEDLAIDRVVGQHDIDAMGLSTSAPGAGAVVKYSRSYKLALAGQQKQREGYEGDSDDEEVFEAIDPPPPTYTCHRCGTTGGKPESHWIWECPTNEDPEHMKKVRVAKGVPRAFLQKVSSIEEGQELSAGGVTFTLPGHSGHYIIAHQEASYEDKKIRVGDTVQEKITTAFTAGARMVEESLKCPLCNQMFRQAILAPCCGSTYCSDCIMDRLAHSSLEHSSCPGCGNEVLAHQLVANEDIRRQVEKIAQSSKAMAIAAQKEKEMKEREERRARELEIDAALKDRVGRSRRRGGGGPDGDLAELLALTDSGSGGGGGGSAAAGSRSRRQQPDRSGAPEARRRPPEWEPLAFGPMLGAEQFAAWKQAIQASRPGSSAREHFERWQSQLRQVSMPPMAPASLAAERQPSQPQQPALLAQPQGAPLSAVFASEPATASAQAALAAGAAAGAAPAAPGAAGPAPPSRESFEEWQRMLKMGSDADDRRARSLSGGARKKAKKEKKEKKARKEAV